MKTAIEILQDDVLLQGDLQEVFDALYHMGVIDPVLDMDWNQAMNDIPEYTENLALAIQAANRNQGDLMLLMNELKKFDDTTLGFLAMEVAREFADYHSRESLH